MEKQKKIPQLRFNEFYGEWEKTTVGDLGVFIGGGTPDTDIKEYWDGNVPWISSSDIQENTIQEYNISRFITEEAIKNSATKIVPRNSVLIVSRVGIGKFAVANSPICTSQDFTSLIPKDSNPYFLAFYFKLKTNLFLRFSQGTSIKGFTGTDIRNMVFLIPTLPEQQKIVSFFTSIDQRISQLRRKKTLLEQYKKGVMQKIFSQEIRFKNDNGQEFPRWEKKKLGLVIDEYRVITKTNNEYEVLTSSNKGLMLQKEYYGENRITERDNIGFNVLPNGYITYRSRSDNGIFTFNLNNLGITGIVSKYYPVFKIKDGSNYFLVEFLNDNYKIISQYSIGTSQKVFPMNAFNNISLSIPCPKEQHKIANFLSAIDDKINHTQKQIEKAEVWKKGLMQQMFV